MLLIYTNSLDRVIDAHKMRIGRGWECEEWVNRAGTNIGLLPTIDFKCPLQLSLCLSYTPLAVYIRLAVRGMLADDYPHDMTIQQIVEPSSSSTGVMITPFLFTSIDEKRAIYVFAAW